SATPATGSRARAIGNQDDYHEVFKVINITNNEKVVEKILKNTESCSKEKRKKIQREGRTDT
uniref:Uncharacterized protein n=1 Tax=Callorhinchus milii TaxID=7868 RepID=A0A4W3JYA4_CALMI